MLRDSCSGGACSLLTSETSSSVLFFHSPLFYHASSSSRSSQSSSSGVGILVSDLTSLKGRSSALASGYHISYLISYLISYIISHIISCCLVLWRPGESTYWAVKRQVKFKEINMKLCTKNPISYLKWRWPLPFRKEISESWQIVPFKCLLKKTIAFKKANWIVRKWEMK